MTDSDLFPRSLSETGLTGSQILARAPTPLRAEAGDTEMVVTRQEEIHDRPAEGSFSPDYYVGPEYEEWLLNHPRMDTRGKLRFHRAMQTAQVDREEQLWYEKQQNRPRIVRTVTGSPEVEAVESIVGYFAAIAEELREEAAAGAGVVAVEEAVTLEKPAGDAGLAESERLPAESPVVISSVVHGEVPEEALPVVPESSAPVDLHLPPEGTKPVAPPTEYMQPVGGLEDPAPQLGAN